MGEIAKGRWCQGTLALQPLASKQAILMPLWRYCCPLRKKTQVKFPIHVQDVKTDLHCSPHISEDALVEKFRQIFFTPCTITVSQFRQMMTLRAVRSPELAELYSRRYVDQMIDYHADIFRALISLGILRAEDRHVSASIRLPGHYPSQRL